jgi:hypothetical protein
MADDEFWMIRGKWISRSSKNHGRLAIVASAMLLTGNRSSPKTEQK